MKILLLGSGGREHAMAWKIAQSQKVEKLYIAPGNPGMQKKEKRLTLKQMISMEYATSYWKNK